MILCTSITKQSDGSWLFIWNPTTSPYEVWLDGKLLETVDDEQYSYMGVHYNQTPPPLEIVDATESSENSQYSPFLNLQWRGTISLAEYLVEELIGSEWVYRASIKENLLGYYRYQTRKFTDGTTSSWRIRAVDSNGNESTDSISFSAEVICNPDPPEVVLSISEGTLTIDEE